MKHNDLQKKKRRKSRVKPKNWPQEIAKGNTDAFYKSKEWDIAREEALIRDKFTCQFFLGAWSDGMHSPDRVEPIKANTVHHTYPIKEYPQYCLDVDKLVSLSFEAHEIIEDRHRFEFKKKKSITRERW